MNEEKLWVFWVLPFSLDLQLGNFPMKTVIYTFVENSAPVKSVCGDYIANVPSIISFSSESELGGFGLDKARENPYPRELPVASSNYKKEKKNKRKEKKEVKLTTFLKHKT